MINDVMGHWPAEKNEKLASRCCTNVRKQHLSQNDVAIIRPIDFDSWFEDVNAILAPRLDTATETTTDFESHWCLSFYWLWGRIDGRFFNDFMVLQLFSEPTHALPVWIHCCKRPNYDFYISQGSVATVLRWGEQNYSHLRQVSSWCCTPKLLTSPMFHGVIKK